MTEMRGWAHFGLEERERGFGFESCLVCGFLATVKKNEVV